jgi:hypothetical protein
MTAIFIAPRVPLTDGNGVCNPIWYRFFSGLFNISGDGATSDATAFEVAPASQFDSLAPLLELKGGDQSPVAQGFVITPDDVNPVAQSFFFSADDVLPLIGSLRDEIAVLRSQIDDIRKGGLVT